jgi:hypothetical protein
VIALSPDKLQQEHFNKLDSGIPFVLSAYERYNPQKRFDLVLMSESCQYIDIEKGALKSKEILKHKGYILVSDYFVKTADKKSIVRRWGPQPG